VDDDDNQLHSKDEVASDTYISEDDSDYEEVESPSDVLTNDADLDSDIEKTVIGSDSEDIDADYQLELLQYHRTAFYAAFTPYYEKVKTSTKLMTNEKYDQIKDIVSRSKAKHDPSLYFKYRRQYKLIGNIERRCLYRDDKVVTTFEQVFDVLLEAHGSIGHRRDLKSNLDTCKDTLGYYGVPLAAVKFFVNTCPQVKSDFIVVLEFSTPFSVANFFFFQNVSQCVPNKNIPPRSKQQPLKMILTKTAGGRFQMDLIMMPEYNGYNYILRVVDHLSKFGYVHPIKQRTAVEVGHALLAILSTSIMPKILQSDNGGEVCLLVTLKL
jgi:hypothetical protein